MSEIAATKIYLITDLFEQRRIFQIPPFQRSYTWEADLFEELWKDIQENVLAPEASREHFMGVFIFSNKDDTDKRESAHAEEIVIDGQQRMTSFAILLRAMYDSLTDKDSFLGGTIYDAIVGGKFEMETYERLVLGEDVNEFFQKYIQEKDASNFRSTRKGKKKVEKRIVKAHAYFLEQIADESKRREMKIDEFVELLYSRLKQSVVAVRIKVSSDADAYSIFETINSKKVELSVSELLKNYLFQQSQRSSDSDLTITRRKWNDLTENLSENGDEIEPSQFIRHFWISNVESVTEKKLYLAIKNDYKKGGKKAKTLVSNLADQSLLYAKIVGARKDEEDKVIDADSVVFLDQIRTLRVKQCYSLLLSALSVEVTKGQFKALLKSIIKVSLLRSLVDRNPNELEAIYAKNALLLRQNPNVLLDVIKEINATAPIADELINYLLENEVSEQLARFLLIQVEKKDRTDETRVNKVSLEHILPRNPENLHDWNLTEQEHKKYVGMLGNLALVGNKLNSEASNKSFIQKKKILQKSDIKTTMNLIKSKRKWEKKDIEARTKELCQFAAENWL